LLVIGLAFAGISLQSAQAANKAWSTNTPGPANGNFSGTNWTVGTTGVATPTSAAATGDALFFDTSAITTLTNDLSGASFVGLTFNSGASAYTIGGNSFTLTGGVTNNSTSLQTINNAITLSNVARTFNAGSGGLTLGGALSGTTGTVTFIGAGTTTLSGTNTINATGANFAAFIVGGTIAGGGGSPAGNVAITGATTVDGTGFTDSRGILDVHGASTLTIQTGGSFTVNGSSSATTTSIIGQNSTGTSTLLVNGGSFSFSGGHGLALGNNRADATGTLTIASGTATITAGSTTRTDARSFIAMGRDNATGIINLNGGTLSTSRYFVRDGSNGGTAGLGTANVNFNGGTLRALADQTAGTGWFESGNTGDFRAVTTTVKVGGAKIDTNSFTTNINTVLAHDAGLGVALDGGLTKSGAGTLSLGAVNTYTGATTISNGTLTLASTGSIANSSNIINNATFNVSAVTGYTVGVGQTLSGTGTVIGNTTIAGTLSIGNSPGTMTFNNNLTLGGTTTMELGGNAVAGTDYDFGNVVGTLNYGGALSIVSYNSYDLAQIAAYNLFDAGTTGAGSFSSVTVGGLALTYSAGTDSWSGTALNGFTYTFTESNGVLTAVPEPAVALLGALGAFTLLRRRRVA